MTALRITFALAAAATGADGLKRLRGGPSSSSIVQKPIDLGIGLGRRASRLLPESWTASELEKYLPHRQGKPFFSSFSWPGKPFPWPCREMLSSMGMRSLGHHNLDRAHFMEDLLTPEHREWPIVYP